MLDINSDAESVADAYADVPLPDPHARRHRTESEESLAGLSSRASSHAPPPRPRLPAGHPMSAAEARRLGLAPPPPPAGTHRPPPPPPPAGTHRAPHEGHTPARVAEDQPQQDHTPAAAAPPAGEHTPVAPTAEHTPAADATPTAADATPSNGGTAPDAVVQTERRMTKQKALKVMELMGKEDASNPELRAHMAKAMRVKLPALEEALKPLLEAAAADRTPTSAAKRQDKAPVHTRLQIETETAFLGVMNNLTRRPTAQQLVHALQTADTPECKKRYGPLPNLDPEDVRKRHHAATQQVYSFIEKHTEWVLLKGTEKSSLRATARDDIIKFLRGFKALQCGDEPWACAINFDEVHESTLPPDTTRHVTTSHERVKRFFTAAEKFTKVGFTIVVGTVLYAVTRHGQTHFHAKVLPPFLIFKGKTDPGVATSLSKFRVMPNIAFTESSFTRTEIMPKILDFFWIETQKLLGSGVSGKVVWVYDNYKAHLVTESWAQAKSDHQYHHVCLPGPPACTWIWQPVDGGIGNTIEVQYEHITNRAVDELRTGGLAEREVDHDTLTGIEAVTTRVRTAINEVNRAQNVTSYWVRMGFIPRQDGYPRASHSGGQHYIGDDYFKQDQAFEPDELPPAEAPLDPAVWGAGSNASKKDRFEHLVDHPAERCSNEALHEATEIELANGPQHDEVEEQPVGRATLPEHQSLNLAATDGNAVMDPQFKQFIRSRLSQEDSDRFERTFLHSRITSLPVFKSCVQVRDGRIFVSGQEISPTHPNEYTAYMTVFTFIREADGDRTAHNARDTHDNHRGHHHR